MQTTDYNPVAGNSATPTAARVLPHAPTEAHASGAQSTPRFRMHLNFTSSSSKSITTARVDSEEAEEVAAGARILVPKGVVGLTNIGNTCFMNASLQCMLRIKVTPIFRIEYLNAYLFNIIIFLYTAIGSVLQRWHVPERPQRKEPNEGRRRQLIRVLTAGNTGGGAGSQNNAIKVPESGMFHLYHSILRES